MNDLFKASPINYENEIPVFSKKDEYIYNYERIAHDHLSHVKKTGNNPWINEELWNEMEDTTLKQINKYVKKGDKILDVGVGTGRLLNKISLDIEKYGMDISMENLGISKEKGINCTYAKIEDMPFKDEAFDIIVTTDVLEHVIDINSCVSKILKTLKKNQYLIARVPYREDLEGYTRLEYPYQFAHLRTFDEYGLKLFFEKELKCEFVEFELTGHYFAPTRLKWGQIPADGKGLKIANFFINKFRKSIKNKNPIYYKNMYIPIEISFVIKKA